jgi:hypothetical protein
VVRAQPQLRIVAVTARVGRAMLGAILGRAGAGEQTLLKRLVKRRPELFAGRVVCFDQNFPGYDLITAILHAGGHLVSLGWGFVLAGCFRVWSSCRWRFLRLVHGFQVGRGFRGGPLRA